MGSRRANRCVVAAAVAVALLAVLALPVAARQDDLPTEIYKPASGAVVKDASHGLETDFTCPTYHQWPQDVLTVAPEGYHVILSTRKDVDLNRLLTTDGRVEVRDARLLDDVPGHCTAVEDDAGNGLLPREPGTYYVQSYRDCATFVCLGGVEVSDVATVTVKRTVCTDNRAALKAARAALAKARTALSHRRTAARRARVSDLASRVSTLHARLTVVYGCHT